MTKQHINKQHTIRDSKHEHGGVKKLLPTRSPKFRTLSSLFKTLSKLNLKVSESDTFNGYYNYHTGC